MRFNKQELITIAQQPSNKFEKEGILYVTEKQDGFFRRTEGTFYVTASSSTSSSTATSTTTTPAPGIYQFTKNLPRRKKSLSCMGGAAKVSLERWCRLRGNLLFYFKTSDQFSEPQGVIVLEKCQPIIHNEQREHDGYVFFIEFQDGLKQRLAANSEGERSDWIQSIRNASYDEMRKQLQILREKIDKRKGTVQDIDVNMIRLQNGKDIDITEIPLCESAISCDNLLCDGNGRPPNPSVVIEVTAQNRKGWIKYGGTEVIERSSNPQFLCTVQFRRGDGLTQESLIRLTVYDVREKVSQTAVPLGSAEIALGVVQDTSRLRIPLRSSVCGNPGFITIASWSPEHDRKTPRSPAKILEQSHNHPHDYQQQHHHIGHRRSQSLPPRLGVKLFVPSHEKLNLLFTNPNVCTYRLHSGLGGEINVQELLVECQLCFIIPQQLLSIWILREKELLQEISGMGELGGEWRNKQMELLDKHLKLLKDYSQAKQNLHQFNHNSSNTYFKKSSAKGDETLEFAPVNLHLQRMWAHNDTLKRSGVMDIITVGAFTRHCGTTKTGGLIKLLQHIKDSPSKVDQTDVKVQTANDAVQAIKQLRKDIVEIMSQLLCLAKLKNPKGMLPLCNEMINKTRSLLSIWEPNLVEEAFEFIENHRIIDEPDNASMPMSPFKRITQQLGALDLKSPDLEDFATPMGPAPDLWPQQIRTQKSSSSLNCPTLNARPSSLLAKTIANNGIDFKRNTNCLKVKSPSNTELNAITSIENTFKDLQENNHRNTINKNSYKSKSDKSLSCSLPVTYNMKSNFKTDEKQNDINPDVNNQSDDVHDQDDNEIKFNETHFDINGGISTNKLLKPNELQQSMSSAAILINNTNINNKNDGGGGVHQHQTFPERQSKENNDESSKSSMESKITTGQQDECSLSYQAQLAESKSEILLNSNEFDNEHQEDFIAQNCSIVLNHGAFLDTKVMSSSPSANYYRPTEEPEPLDLTQLNIEASVMCLVSKVKFLCGRCGSPAVRLRQPKQSIKRGFKNSPPDVVTNQPIPITTTTNDEEDELNGNSNNRQSLPFVNVPEDINNTNKTTSSTVAVASTTAMITPSSIFSTKPGNLNSKELNLALTEAVGEVTRKVKKGNKFTDGLDLSATTDWASELRPSMRKLRQAMDGLLKTARLMHSVQRLQQDMKKTTAHLNIMYRRDVCFSQALTALISGLMCKLWGTQITENYIQVLYNLGPLAYFEGLLSLYGNETDMWGDMCVAIEDLCAVRFTLIRSNIQRDTKALPIPRIVGSRQSLNVLLPIPESVYCLLPTKAMTTFKVTTVFFNIGINEKATLSETLGYTREQHRSNWDNFDRLKQYHIRYKKLNLIPPDTPSKTETIVAQQTISEYLCTMEESLRANPSKNIKILHLAEDICRAVNGIRLTSCKSAKDRTAMAVTLEQCRILQKEFHLPATSLQNVLNTMRSEGTRRHNTVKNIGIRRYAFNLPQVLYLPQIYRPPSGTYRKAQS